MKKLKKFNVSTTMRFVIEAETKEEAIQVMDAWVDCRRRYLSTPDQASDFVSASSAVSKNATICLIGRGRYTVKEEV